MAESRRSGRAHKKVDYSRFGGNEENDSEDDFADFNPPAKKKKITGEQKETKKKESTKKTSSSKTSEKTKKEQRLSLEEKLYQRDLELALQLSKQDTPSSSQPETSSTSQSELEQAATKGKLYSTEDSSDIASIPTPTPSTDSAERPVETQSADSDLEEPSTRKKRQSRVKTQPRSTNKENGGRDEESRVEDIDDEEEGQEVSSEDEDSDFDPDEDDSDYETSRKRTQSRRGRGRGRGGATEKRPRPKPRLSATVTPIKTFSGKSASPRPRGKGLGRAIVGLSAALSYNSDGSSGRDSPDVSHMLPARSSSGELIIRKPKWCPPGPAGTSKSGGGGISKSPAQIRVGLSKNQKIKPLHPVRPASNGD
ncbi:PREDICTED: RAD51-associated protein 1-like isoform X1 [Branchiostoma belcheri]|uniref:RAD51-associated protein 1-like isoform X1 n=1 Tax=Branchiostoma belcheri TaxID=7741 RepID=A0A6P5AHK5_BRABE|nr:PREDICTED: RAD51-associated protein 1-like isoform X1 [Branchiostoma belcheri]